MTSKIRPPPPKKKHQTRSVFFCFETFHGKDDLHINCIRKNIDKKVDIPLNMSSPWLPWWWHIKWSIYYLPLPWLRGRMTVCNFLFHSAYMVCGLTKFKMFHKHTARNSIHCVHIFPAFFKNNEASQRVKYKNYHGSVIVHDIGYFVLASYNSHAKRSF